MRKALLSIIFASVAYAAFAQPRSLGVRLGFTGLEADYQHSMSKNQFLQGNLGLDCGLLADSKPGIKATAIYNFIWARPAWTHLGTWAMYAGPGASIGYVYDSAYYKEGLEVRPYVAPGFMLGVCAQVGLEYTFWFPMQASIDLRPTLGMHADKDRAGLYDSGFLGFCPTLSLRYRF